MEKIRKNIIKFAPHMVWTMLLSVIYAIIASLIYSYVTPENLPSNEIFYLKGLTILIPLILLKFSIEKSRYIWQYIITGVILILFMYFVFNCFVLAFFTFALFASRFFSRVDGESNELNNVNKVMLIAYIVLFLYTGFLNYSFFQLVSIYHCLFSALLIFAYHGLVRFESFIEIRREKSNLPAKRILDNATKIFLVFSLIVVLIVMPTIMYEYDFVSISFTQDEQTYEQAKDSMSQTEESENENDVYSSDFSWSDFDSNSKISQIFSEVWKFLDDYVLAFIILIFLYVLIKGVYAVIISFNDPQIIKTDVIESTFKKDQDQTELLVDKIRFNDFFDFSLQMQIRKRYKKEYNKYKPKNWQTPSEIENLSKKSNEELHELYINARYNKKA